MVKYKEVGLDMEESVEYSGERVGGDIVEPRNDSFSYRKSFKATPNAANLMHTRQYSL